MSTAEVDVERLPVEELRKLFLFEALTDEQLQFLHERGWVENYPAGSTVFSEGEEASIFVILLSGLLSMSRRVDDAELELVRTDHVGAYAGATQSYFKGSDVNQYSTSVRAVTDMRLFAIEAKDFAYAMQTWFPMAMHLLEGLFLGMRNTQRLVGQRQQLLALGALSAGLTHELNNPAAAAVRATSSLRERFAGMRHKMSMLAHHELDPRLLELLVDLQEEAVQSVASAPKLSALEESEREEEIGDWLDDHSVSGAFELAPIFVGAGTPIDFLQRVIDEAPDELRESAIRWLAYTLETELLLAEVTDSVTRISSLVDAAKQYSNMDRSPFERADIHSGIESTLVMLNTKLKGIEVIKDFDRTLPPVPVYAGEINQVWTNIIDNAAQAMNGSGTLTISTALDHDRVCVEISDSGPGMPPEVKERIFEPFFTTKPIGQGTGLGLDISYRIVVQRHNGDLRVESEPGNTRFRVCLPLTEQAQT